MTDSLTDRAAPRAAFPAGSSAAALAAILGAEAGVFADHLAQLQHSDAPEHPHKARVALRRLRSALDGFAPILSRRARDRLGRQARNLFRILGPLREADVAAEKFAGPEDDGAMRASADAIRARVRAELAAAGAEKFAAQVAAALAGDALIDLDSRARRLAAAPVAVLAQFALQKAWTEVQGFGTDLAALSDEDRHEFRKDIKTLRYLSEFLGDGWPGKGRDRFLARMEKLQHSLGELNDIAVHTGGAPAEGELRGAYEASLTEAQAHWQKLAALGPWWF